MKKTLRKMIIMALAAVLTAGTAAGCGTKIEVSSEKKDTVSESTVSSASVQGETSGGDEKSGEAESSDAGSKAAEGSEGASEGETSGEASGERTGSETETSKTESGEGTESSGETEGSENSEASAESGTETSKAEPGGTDSEIQEFDVSKLTKEKLVDCYTGEGQHDDRTYEAVYLKAKDGGRNFAVIYLFDVTDKEKPAIADYVNGEAATLSESVWEDGALHSYGTIKDTVRSVTVNVNMTDYGNDRRDVVFDGTGIYFKLSAVKDFKDITAKLAASKKIFDEAYEEYISKKSAEDAQTLDAACRKYFADVISGKLTAETNGLVTLDSIPSSYYTDLEGKKEMVAKLTVGGALQYAGIDPESFGLVRFEIDEDGKFVVKGENDGLAIITDVTSSTLLREFFKD